MIRAGGLVVRLGGREVLSGVDAVARDGRVTGVVGPNGSGKSTLLRALVRAERAAAGRVEIEGRDVRSRSRRWIAQRVAFVGQRADPDPALLVADEVALGGVARHGVRRAGGARFDEQVVDALAAVGLADVAERPVGALSGGQRQRVAIARAIAQGADHVLLDEPLNHLDLRARLELAALLPRIAPTVVVVVHDLEIAHRWCDDVLLLSRGRVAAVGSPGEVLVPEVLDAVYGVRSHPFLDPDGERRFAFRLPDPSPHEGAIT